MTLQRIPPSSGDAEMRRLIDAIRGTDRRQTIIEVDYSGIEIAIARRLLRDLPDDRPDS